MQKVITAYVIAYNEAEKIADAVSSIRWADEVIVADLVAPTAPPRSPPAGSRRSRRRGDSVRGFRRPAQPHAAACQHDWIFSFDSTSACTADAVTG